MADHEELIAWVQHLCCPRIHGCEVNDADECPAQRVRIALETLTAENERLRHDVQFQAAHITALEIAAGKQAAENERLTRALETRSAVGAALLNTMSLRDNRWVINAGSGPEFCAAVHQLYELSLPKEPDHG